MYKFLVWHVLIVTVSCELFAQESGYLLDYAPKYDNYRPRDYHFNYAVSDPHTGDHKSQWEVKENGVVRGAYSLLEPDGTTRIVEYTADDDGFRAIVKKLGTAIHPEPVVPIVPQVAHYRAYDGQLSNYGTAGVTPALYQIQQNIGHTATVLPQSEAVGTIQAVPQIQQNIGHIATVLPQSEAVGTIQAVPQVEAAAPVVPVGHSYSYEQNFGGIGSTLADDIRPVLTSEVQGQDVATISAVPLAVEQGVGKIEDLSRIEAVPLIQGRIEELPITEAQWRSIGADLTRLEELSLQGEVQGRNLASLEAVPVQGYNLERIDSVLGDQNLGRIEAVQGHRIGADLGRVEAVPVLQGQNIDGIGEGLGRIGAAPVQGYNVGRVEGDLGRGEVVPILQGQNIGGIGEGWGRIGAAPVQGYNVGRIEGDLGRGEAVPILQGQNLGPIGSSLGRIDAAPVQGYNLGTLDGRNLGGIEAVPVQGQDIRRVEAVRLPQPQIEIHAARPLPERYDNSIGQGAVPIGPSGTYTTNIEYHGLTGNPEDDSRYTQDRKDVYHASYSQKVPKVVPAPSKREKLSKKEFLIYYPEAESH